MPTINTRQRNATVETVTVDIRGEKSKREERQEIYNTPRWKRLRKSYLMKNPVCEICYKELATQVHHKDSFMNYTGETRKLIAYDEMNLQALCVRCHSEIHCVTH